MTRLVMVEEKVERRMEWPASINKSGRAMMGTVVASPSIRQRSGVMMAVLPYPMSICCPSFYKRVGSSSPCLRFSFF